MKKCKNIYTLLTCGIGCILLAGCQTDNPPSPAGTSPAKDMTAAPAAAETADYSELFSDRDLSGDYESSEAIYVTLTGASAACESSDVTVKGSVITITKAGTYLITGTLDDGMIIVDTDKGSKVQLVLNGMSVNSNSSAAIYIKQADKVFITTSKDSENTLSNGGVYESVDENNIDAVIFSKDDLTLNGSGKLTINAAAGHGVVSKDDLIITGGTYTITSEKNGLFGKDIVGIANGTFTITSSGDGINSDSDLYIADGVFDLASGDDGLHADNSLTVKNGTITVSESYEGIEGAQITIDGGTITVYADDDGLNAAAGTGAQIEENCIIAINGGILKIIADGDGIDSNGSLIQTGGEAYVCGPTDSANAALDFGTEIQFEGGIMIAVDDSRMQEHIKNSPMQGVIRTETGSQSAGTNITITDENGVELLSFTPEKSYGTITVSHPDIRQGNNYIITAGNDVINISMDSLLYDDVPSGPGRP